MANINDVFAEKYDFSQFESFVEIVNTSDDFLENSLLKAHQDMKSFIICAKETEAGLKNKTSVYTKFLDASNAIPKGYKLYISKNITDILDIDQFFGFLNNMAGSMETYSRLVLLEKNIEVKEIEEVMNIKNLNDIDYTLSESGFFLTNAIKIADKTYILEILKK